MIYIKYNKIGKVTSIHYMPFHEKHGLGKTQEQLEQEGILVDSIPEPQQIEGKTAILYCNPETKELWYEYEDIPKTQEEIQDEIISLLRQEIVNLKLESLEKDNITNTLGQELTNIKLQLLLQGGEI